MNQVRLVGSRRGEKRASINVGNGADKLTVTDWTGGTAGYER